MLPLSEFALARTQSRRDTAIDWLGGIVREVLAIRRELEESSEDPADFEIVGPTLDDPWVPPPVAK